MSDNLFLSNNNKALLWDMLLSNNMFNGINNDKFSSVKIMFDNVIMQIGEKNKNNITKEKLVNLNKAAILDIKNNLEFFKRDNNQNTFNDEKILIFDKNLEMVKNDFNDSITIKKPTELEFSLDKDKPFSSDNMNEMLEKLQQEREKLISSEKIPVNDNPQQNPQQNSIEYNDSNNLKKITNINELFTNQEQFDNNFTLNQNLINKHVTFKDNNLENQVKNEYNIERKINSENKINSILTILKEIGEKQNKILELLENSN